MLRIDVLMQVKPLEKSLEQGKHSINVICCYCIYKVVYPKFLKTVPVSKFSFTSLIVLKFIGPCIPIRNSKNLITAVLALFNLLSAKLTCAPA